MRGSPQRVAEMESDDIASGPDGASWATLREANRATGIPVETLRKWARRGTIPTYLTATAAGPNIRMVDLEGVKTRAEDLGRTINQPVPSPPPTAAAQAATAGGEPLQEPPTGTMIVPVDAWNKMLTQLGNLHEAGQQLATARERAAKAETEATFLRERLAELRNDAPPLDAETSTDSGQSATINSDEPTPSSEKVWQFFVRRFRDRGTG